MPLLRKRTPRPPSPDAEALKKSPTNLQPDVWLFEKDGRKIVLKTFKDSHPLPRATLCRWVARREARNLKLLHDVAGVPRLLGMPDPTSIEMTLLDADSLIEEKKGHGLDHAFFDQLEELIQEIHSHRLNYGDLRRKNIMQDRQTKRPCLVDFAQCFYFRWEFWPFSAARRLFFEVDRQHFLKLKKWYLGGKQLTPEEYKEHKNPPGMLTLGRFYRQNIYRRLKDRRKKRRR